LIPLGFCDHAGAAISSGVTKDVQNNPSGLACFAFRATVEPVLLLILDLLFRLSLLIVGWLFLKPPPLLLELVLALVLLMPTLLGSSTAALPNPRLPWVLSMLPPLVPILTLSTLLRSPSSPPPLASTPSTIVNLIAVLFSPPLDCNSLFSAPLPLPCPFPISLLV
jgi:hypothetical protein